MPNNVTSTNHHPSTKELFDYGKLDPSVAREAKAVAANIRARNQAFVIETGRDLYRVKQRLGHGLFSAPGGYLRGERCLFFDGRNSSWRLLRPPVSLLPLGDDPVPVL
jgi:hypothetical protein